MPNYAAIDKDNKVIDLMSFDTPVKADNFIQVQDFDTSIIGKIYDKAAGTFGTPAPVVAVVTPVIHQTATVEDIQEVEKKQDDLAAKLDNSQVLAGIAQVVADCQNLMTMCGTIISHLGNLESASADIKAIAQGIEGHFVASAADTGAAAAATEAAATTAPAQTVPANTGA